MTDPCRRFRDLLHGSICHTAGSVFDPLSARLAEQAGFEIGIFAGSTASLTVLGAPDLVVLSHTELADQARRICRASQLPILVDADAGYGNALNVMRTIEDLIVAGIAAASIEDTLLPTAFGAPKSTELISLEEGIGKMRAAVDARKTSAFSILARTSAPNISSFEDAIQRLQAYEATGVDGLFVVGLKTSAQLHALSSATKLPLVLANPPLDVGDDNELAQHRVRLCIRGHQPIMAALEALRQTYLAQRSGQPLPALISAAHLASITKAADYENYKAAFLQADRTTAE